MSSGGARAFPDGRVDDSGCASASTTTCRRGMWPMARRLLPAHLIKLEAEGRVRRHGED